MARTEASNGNFVVAAAVGGLFGGIAALLATRGLPKMLSGMKEHMHEICGESCECLPSDAEAQSASESTETPAN